MGRGPPPSRRYVSGGPAGRRSSRRRRAGPKGEIVEGGDSRRGRGGGGHLTTPSLASLTHTHTHVRSDPSLCLPEEAGLAGGGAAAVGIGKEGKLKTLLPWETLKWHYTAIWRPYLTTALLRRSRSVRV